MKKIYIGVLIIMNFVVLSFSRFVVDASETLAYQIGGNIKDTKKLNDNNNENRYNLYEFTNGGYLIFDTLNNDICEYSLKSKSPYEGYEDDVYYFGPTTYSYLNENKLINIHYNEYANYDDLCINNVNSNNLVSSLSVRTASSISSEIYKIPYSFYFELLDDITNDFPTNHDGDCGYVAASIVLSYYDTFYNDGFVSDVYMRKSDNSNFNYNEWTKVPCVNYLFKNLLHTYHNDNSTTAFSINSIIESYMQSNANDIAYSSVVGILPNYTDLVDFINDGFPVILFGNFNYEDNDSLNYTFFHAIIAYGYDFLKGHILTHFGWEGYSNVWVNYHLFSASIVGSSYRMKLNNVEHSHSSNFTVNNHAYCPVDNVHVDTYDKVYEQYSTTHHTVNCSCDFAIGLEEHMFLGLLSLENEMFAVPVRDKICSKCGYTVSVIS